jgi:hypothetical protein
MIHRPTAAGGAERGRNHSEGRALIHFLAYVDLTSGSLVVQLVIASIVAIPFLLRTQIRRAFSAVRALVRRSRLDASDGARRD